MPSVREVVPAAAVEADRYLSALPVRLRHVSAVAATARLVEHVVPVEDRELLVAAAWLHDIGYAEELAATGFHPLDGARYLRAAGASDRLCRLVANHSLSIIEAAGRGLKRPLEAEFPAERSLVADALTYADMTTGPDGEPLTVEERLAEILRRYPSEHVVHQAISVAAPDIVAAVRRVEARLAE